jgi:hypothetical protein
MILSRLVRFLRINELMDKFDRLLKEYSLTYSDIIISEHLSKKIYRDSSHVGEKINLLELKNLLEPNMSCNSFRSKL